MLIPRRILALSLQAAALLTTLVTIAQAQPRSVPVAPGALVRRLTHVADSAGLAALTPLPARAGDDPEDALLFRATVARLRFAPDSAAPLYATLRASRRPALAAHATLGSALLAGQQSQYAQARQTFHEAAVAMARVGDVSGEVESLVGEALATLRTAGVDSARTVLRTAATRLPATDPWLRARHECAWLQVAVRAAEPIADSTWRRALDGARAQGPRTYAECLFARAQAVEAGGFVEQALATLDTLASVQRSARLLNGLAATRQWQGYTLTTRGRYGPAREALREAGTIAQSIGNRGLEGWAALNLGQLAQRIGAWRDAREYLARARTLLTATGDRTGQTFANLTTADGLLLRGELVTAERAYAALMPTSVALAPLIALPSLIARADIANRQGQAPRSLQLLDSATTLSRTMAIDSWDAELRFQRGLVALGQGDVRHALSTWSALLADLQDTRPPARFEVRSRMAEAEAMAGRLDGAWHNIESAQQTLDVWRRARPRRDDQVAALQDRHLDWDADLGLATLIARFAAAHRAPEALAISEWRRLRANDVQLLNAQSLATSTDTAAAARPAPALALSPTRLTARARAMLPITRAVVSFAVGRGGEPTTAFVLTRDSLISVRLAPIDSLADAIERFSAFLAAGSSPPRLARSLGAALLDPITALLPSTVRRVTIVPDGMLHRLPFAALTDATQSPIALRYELATAPTVEDALGAVDAARVGGARAEASSRGRVMLIGAPAIMPTTANGATPWSPLPGARRELRVISAMLAGREMLDGRDASAASFLRDMPRGGRVLHIASHAVSDPGSFDGSGIVLQSSAAHPGLVSVAELAARPMPFDLVVLSACASADGLMVSGQSLQGLASTALDAGARGVLATRWRVDDATIVPFVEAFYRALLEDGDVVAALHRTRRDAIARGVSPAVWANFEYAGDPTLQVTLQARRGGVTFERAWPWLLAMVVLAAGYGVATRFSSRSSLRT